MRKRSRLEIVVLVGLLVLALATPASAAPTLRLYRGQTSEGQRIKFIVAKTDSGRFVQELDIGVTFTCEDATTQDWGLGWGFGRRSGPAITEGAFTYDEVDQFMAVHFTGRLGTLSGEGTASIAIPSMTIDEQAQLCTTGDLTWTVEFIRRL